MGTMEMVPYVSTSLIPPSAGPASIIEVGYRGPFRYLSRDGHTPEPFPLIGHSKISCPYV